MQRRLTQRNSKSTPIYNQSGKECDQNQDNTTDQMLEFSVDTRPSVYQATVTRSRDQNFQQLLRNRPAPSRTNFQNSNQVFSNPAVASNLKLKDVSIDKISGKNNQDIAVFLQQYERAAKACALSDDREKLFLPSYLTDPADKIYEMSSRAHPYHTYSDWIIALTNRCRPEDYLERKRDE